MSASANNSTGTRGGWLAAWVFFISTLHVPYQFLLQSATSVMIPPLMMAFSTTATGIGFITSSFFYTYVFLQIPAGILVDKIGPKKCLMGGIVLTACACFWFAHAHTVSAAVASRMVMGLACAPAVPAALFIACQWFEPKYFAMLAGMAESIGMAGGGIGQMVLAHAVKTHGWQPTMLGMAVIGVVLVIAVLLFVKNFPTYHVNRHVSPSKVWHCLRDALRYKQVWLCGIYGGLLFAVLPAFAGLWGVPYFRHVAHLDLQHAATACGLMFIGTAFGCPFWGWLSDYLKCRKPLLIVSALLTTLLLLALFYLSPCTCFYLYALCFLIGFASASYALTFALARDHTPKHVRGTAMGFINMMCMIIGAPLLQPIIGGLLHLNRATAPGYFSVASFHHVMTIIPGCTALALILLLFIHETGCQEKHH